MFDSANRISERANETRRTAYRTCTSFDLGQPPLVGLLVLVVQRLNLLLLLPLTDFGVVGHPEELRSHFCKPFGLDGSDIVAVLASREDQLVVNQPFRRAIEQCRGWMDINRCAFDEGFVPFLRILFGGISEEARTNGLSNDVVVAPSGNNVVFISERD